MGNGWIMEADGMRKLEPSEPGGAMPGVQIFESVGTAVDESQQDGSEVHAAEPGQATTSKFRGLDRQSGVPGICWNRQMACWRTSVQQAGKRKRIQFFIAPFLKKGRSEDEAVEAALREAKAHREELVRKGVLKPPKTKAANPQQTKHSTVRGVGFDNVNQKWRVRLTDPNSGKVVHGSKFATQEEAELKARELAKELGLKEELIPVKHLSELKHFEPLGPQPGVKWRLGGQYWRARCIVNGKDREMTFQPNDLSEKEVEKAWKQAVAWRKQQEKERDQAKKR